LEASKAAVFAENAKREEDIEEKFERFLLNEANAWIQKDEFLMSRFRILIDESGEHAKAFQEMWRKIIGKNKAHGMPPEGSD
jgi:hypothetical protein